jgi:hypothetical protein
VATADLRYPIGEFAGVTPASADLRRASIDDIRRLPERMREAVRGLSDARLDSPYRPGGWTVRQLVHHVADSHMNGYIRVKLALTEETPTIKPYDENAWATLPDSLLPIGVSLAILDNLHARWVALYPALSDAELGHRFFHPERNEQMTLDTHLICVALTPSSPTSQACADGKGGNMAAGQKKDPPVAQDKLPAAPLGDALGMIETRGLVGMIEAADAMLKTANVVLVSWQKVDAGLVTAIIRATWGPSRPPRTRAPPPRAAWASWSACTSFHGPPTTSRRCFRFPDFGMCAGPALAFPRRHRAQQQILPHHQERLRRRIQIEQAAILRPRIQALVADKERQRPAFSDRLVEPHAEQRAERLDERAEAWYREATVAKVGEGLQFQHVEGRVAALRVAAGLGTVRRDG